MGLLDRALAPYTAGMRDLDPRIHWMVVGSFLAVAARMSAYTFLVLYFVNTLRIDPALVGLSYLCESAARAFSAPLFGALSDRLGRWRVLMPGLVAQTLALPAFVLVSGPVSMFAWSVALGLASGAQQPASSALLLDLAPPEARPRVLSLQYTAISLGYTLGVAPAGYLAGLGYQTLAVVGFVGFAGIVVIYALFVRGPLPPQPRPERSFLASAARAPSDPVFAAFALLALMFPLGIGLMFSVTPLFASDVGLAPGPVGLLLSVNGIILVLFSIPVAKRIEAVGPFRWLGFAGVWVAASFLILGLVPDAAWAILLGTCVFTVGELFFGPILPVAVAALAPPGERGAYQGAWGMAFGLGVGSALWLASLLQRQMGWARTWLLFGAVFAIVAECLLLARAYFRRIADERSATSSPSAGGQP